MIGSFSPIKILRSEDLPLNNSRMKVSNCSFRELWERISRQTALRAIHHAKGERTSA